MLEKTQKSHIKSIYLDKKTLKKLDSVSNNLAVSRSALIRILINQYCKDSHGSYEGIETHVESFSKGGK